MVRAGDLRLPSDAYTYMGIEKGYFQEQGIEVALEQFDTAARMIAPMGAGQLDVGRGTNSAGLFNAIARGVPIKIVANLARVIPGINNYALVIRSDLSGEIRSYADLRGRTLAYNGQGTGNEVDVDRVMQKANLTIDDAEAVPMPFPDMVPALGNGAIDAALLVEPFITLGLQRGVLARWRDGSDFALGHELSMLMYAPGFAQERPEVARRYMAAYLRGLRDYYEAFFGGKRNQDEVIGVLTKYTNIKDPNLYKQMAPHGVDPNGRVNVESLKADQEWFLARGQQQARVDMDQAVDHEYVNAALERLGVLQGG
jgi:ABC-type nitrate/sulfonate/bicarbonate transport system substrate-binding protein